MMMKRQQLPSNLYRMLSSRLGWLWWSRRITLTQWASVLLVGIGLGLAALLIARLPSKFIPIALIVVVCPFAAAVVGDLRRLCLAVILLDMPLQIDFNIGYREQAAAVGALGGLNLSLTTGALLVLYVLWISELLLHKGSGRIGGFHPSLPALLYLGTITCSLWTANDGQLAQFELFLIGQLFLLSTYIACTIQTRNDVLFIMSLLLAGLCLEGSIIMAMNATGSTLNLPGVSGTVWKGAHDGGARLGGTLGSPNTAAAYLSLLLAPALGVLLADVATRYKRLALAALGLGGIALVLTFSRGGWIAFLLSSGLVCWCCLRRGWLSPAKPLIAVCGGLVLLAPFSGEIVQRIFGDDEGSAHSRVPLMRIAWRIIGDHPWFGVGGNNFGTVIHFYATPEFNGGWLYTVHNQYMLTWAELGIGGLIAFVIFLLANLWGGYRCWQLNDRLLALVGLGCATAILGHMTHMFVDFFNERPTNQALWLSAGLIIAIIRIGQRERTQRRHP